MRILKTNKYTAMSWMWVLLISILTVLKIAPTGLNADILLNSVMSLQNLTLYYWGQNRLLSVLPFITAPITDPTINLAAILIITSASFYSLLYILAIASVLLFDYKNKEALSFLILIVTSCVFVTVLKNNAISEITIGHIEYSLPTLLLVYAALNIFDKKLKVKKWHELIIPIFAIILAIGINPAIFVPAFLIPAAIVFYRKKFAFSEILFLMISICSFIAWNITANKYGNLPYNKFESEILYTGLEKVLIGILSIFNLPVLFICLSITLFTKVLHTNFWGKSNLNKNVLLAYTGTLLLIFSTGWLILFSSSQWIAMNDYNWRYFIFVIFAFILIFMLHLSKLLSNWKVKYLNILAGLAAIVSILVLLPYNDRMKFGSYDVFKRVDSLSDVGSSFYAGDYWLVWPSVLRDMMNGHQAYGLTYRGDANKEEARDYMLKIIKEKGQAKVQCLNDTIPNCIAQTNSVVGPLHAAKKILIDDKVSIIEFIE